MGFSRVVKGGTLKKGIQLATKSLEFVSSVIVKYLELVVLWIRCESYSMDHRLIINMDQRTHMYGYEGSLHPSECQVTLKNKDLWKKFHDLETEMIITKSGRRMFPGLQIQISNLDPHAHYCILLEMTPISHCRYKYSTSGGWAPAGTEEAQSPHRVYLHPESPATGEYFMSQPVSFNRLKLTNTPTPPVGHIVLSSMHKYQPRIVIAKTSNPRAMGWAPSTSVVFPETQFVAVTAYQNERITKLKIDNNPFAKGFRENGMSKCKRKKLQMDENDERPSKELCPEDNSFINVEDDRISVSSSTSSSPESSKNLSLSPVPSTSQSPLSVPSKPIQYTYPPTMLNMYSYPYYYHHQYPVYPPVWNATPCYYQQPLPPMVHAKDLTVQVEKEKPKKLTDFSIRAITGLS